MSYVLGLDLGTSSLKGILVNKKGEIIATKFSEYPLYVPHAGYSEQDPKLWIDAAVIVIKELLNEIKDMANLLEGISFSGQMHSLVLLDNNDEPLRNAILWNDVRTTKQCEDIMSSNGHNVLQIAKNIALEGFTLPKILWVKENEPEIWKQVKHFLLPKDYLGFCMTGNKQMEYSDAAGTLLLDVEKREWSFDIASKFGIPNDIFPKLVNSSDKIGVLKPELVELFGFTREVSVFAGAADNAASAIGAGITKEGQAMCSIGTSGVFLTYEKACRDYDGKLHFFNHAVENSFYSMGVTLSAGHSLNWFKQTFAEDIDYDELLNGISELSIAGLLFTPYIVGERTPHVDSKIRGSFIGIDTTHTKKHFAKAVLEGITFSLKDSQVLMEEVSGKAFNTIVSVGGGAKNKDWLQMQADIFNSTITTLKTEQGPAMGAAILAAVGSGWFDSIEDCVKQFIEYTEVYSPITENVEAYDKAYHLYKEVYTSTKNLCHGLLS